MTPTDRAAELLPCILGCDGPRHWETCPAHYRPAVARALEEATGHTGQWHCAKCGLHLVANAFDPSSGAVGIDTRPQDCPNDGIPMRELTWPEWFNHYADGAEKYEASLRAQLEEARVLLHRFQHGAQIESDYICEAGEKLANALSQLEEARRDGERLIGRIVDIRMTKWVNDRQGEFTQEECERAEQATRQGVEAWLRKQQLNAARAKESSDNGE